MANEPIKPVHQSIQEKNLADARQIAEADKKANRDAAYRTVALDNAVKAQLGNTYNEDKNVITDANKLVEGATKIYEFLKGGEK